MSAGRSTHHPLQRGDVCPPLGTVQEPPCTECETRECLRDRQLHERLPVPCEALHLREDVSTE